MKQTITILSALVAALLVASGFIVAANIDLCTTIAQRENELLDTRSELADCEAQLERRTQENKASAETLRKTMEERDALSQQLNDAILASQEANDAVTQQVRQNEKQLRELEALAAEYEDLSQACSALEGQIAELSEAAAQSALSYEAQTLADAQRIAELEKALEEALAPTASPVPVPSETPAVKRPALPPSA